VTISPAFGDRSALVVFVDHTECHWLRTLKPGFRHCFVALQHGSAWLICDSLKSHMELTLVHPPEAFDLAQYYVDQGHRVLLGRTALLVPRTGVSIAPLTCVTIAKRLLGVRAPRVWTPWQLFCHLANAQPGRWRLDPANRPPSKLDKQW
jgi:hypothetical protein